MITFDVHTKDGKYFTLELGRFTFDENGFTLYDDIDAASKAGYLSFEKVAAIVPKGAGAASDKRMRVFQVYLKKRDYPIEIAAAAFNTAHEPSVRFFWRDYFGEAGTEPDVLIENVYVAISEVVAIVPAEGLVRKLS